MSAAPRVIELPQRLDLPAAAPLAAALMKRVGAPLTLDASRVERLGASCTQVLLAAVRSWGAEGDALALRHPSPGFLEDLKLLGLDPGAFLNGVMGS